MENALGSKSECSKSIYCPARYCKDWAPGIFKIIWMTSWFKWLISSTRQGILLSSIFARESSSSTAMYKSVFALHWHSSAIFASASSWLIAEGSSPSYSTSPFKITALHCPQNPFWQPYGKFNPLERAPFKTDSSPLLSKDFPLTWFKTVNIVLEIKI